MLQNKRQMHNICFGTGTLFGSDAFQKGADILIRYAVVEKLRLFLGRSLISIGTGTVRGIRNGPSTDSVCSLRSGAGFLYWHPSACCRHWRGVSYHGRLQPRAEGCLIRFYAT